MATLNICKDAQHHRPKERNGPLLDDYAYPRRKGRPLARVVEEYEEENGRVYVTLVPCIMRVEGAAAYEKPYRDLKIKVAALYHRETLKFEQELTRQYFREQFPLLEFVRISFDLLHHKHNFRPFELVNMVTAVVSFGSARREKLRLLIAP